MSDDDHDYLFDKAGEPDPEVAELERALGAAKYVSPGTNRADRVQSTPSSRSLPRPRRIFPFLAPLALAAAVVLALFLRKWLAPSGPSLTVTTVEGAPRVDTHAIRGKERLEVGAWLETDRSSRADIELREIGHVTVGPGSRVKVAAIAQEEQRLELERGVIEAKVRAMPRLFVVDTPSARATDLGCAYRLEVLAEGGTLLRVTSGAVELAGAKRQAHVPAGASCETRPGRGPGCPYFDDAPEAFKTALRHVDFDLQPSADALATLLATARVHDTLTLWQLVWRLDVEGRSRVLARVMELVPPQPDTDLGNGAPAEFQKYQDQLMTHW